MKRNSRHPEPALAFFWTFLGGLFLFNACSKKPVGSTEQGPARARLIDTISEAPASGFRQKRPLSFDLSLKADMPENTRRLKASVRMFPDSILWASVAPSFGIEVARLLLRKDSLFMIDRMNDRYYQGKPGLMRQRAGIPLDLALLESALFGRPAISHEKGFKLYQGAGDTLQYRPIIPSDLEELLGLGRTGVPIDTVDMDPPSVMKDSLDRVVAREGIRYLPFYWVADSTDLLLRSSVIDLQKRSVLDLRYLSYQTLDSTKVPADIRAKVRSPKGISTFEIGIEGVSAKDSLSFPFRIPDGYAPIRP